MKTNIKNKILFIIFAIIILLALFNLTVYAEEAYYSIKIGGNAGDYVSSVNLLLGEHETETLKAKVFTDYEVVDPNAVVTWESDATDVVTINSEGVLTAVAHGTATITASANGVSDTCKVNVYDEPEFTDFSNAEYETTNNAGVASFNISGVNFSNNVYKYTITADTTKPDIASMVSDRLL